jgi:hypothetical protein
MAATGTGPAAAMAARRSRRRGCRPRPRRVPPWTRACRRCSSGSTPRARRRSPARSRATRRTPWPPACRAAGGALGGVARVQPGRRLQRAHAWAAGPLPCGGGASPAPRPPHPAAPKVGCRAHRGAVAVPRRRGACCHRLRPRAVAPGGAARGGQRRGDARRGGRLRARGALDWQVGPLRSGGVDEPFAPVPSSSSDLLPARLCALLPALHALPHPHPPRSVYPASTPPSSRWWRPSHPHPSPPTPTRRSVYPRIDPAIITLVTAGDWALLGRKAEWPAGRCGPRGGL